MKLLKEDFVSSWSLLVDLEAMKKSGKDPKLARIAAHHIESYEFPVMMMVALPNGTVIDSINANEFLDMNDGPSLVEAGFQDPSGVAYAKFLKAAKEKAAQVWTKKAPRVNLKTEL